jgi:putative chitinase
MKVNRRLFYLRLRIHFGRFRTSQVEGFEAIFDRWEKSGFKDVRWLAYMLATAWHETARTMQAIEEFGKGKGRPYGRKIKHSRVPYKLPNKIYFGRGLVQITWYENYELMGRLIGIDLLNNPELALELSVAIEIMFEGMTKGSSSFGDFTGRSLEQYFNAKTNDPIGARRIINGTDKDVLIASHHDKFLKCLV